MAVDFAPAAADYARYRVGFPASFFDRLATFGAGLRGQAVIDLGTGTGDLARAFARRGCRVIGIDRAPALLEQARALDRAARVAIDYRLATAEDTDLPGDSADVVTAGQCWHWFDRPAAMREAARLLRDDGRLVIAHFDWLPLAGNVVEATERIIKRHNWTWRRGGGNGMHPGWLRELGEAGYRDLASFSYDVEVPYTPEAWRGRVRASAGVAASLSTRRVRAVDRGVAALLARDFPEPTLLIPHRVFAIIGSRPAGAAMPVARRRWALGW
ncbi:MAG TPA: class I SAM-dependent methyltransferase [Candidatus Binatia bacterium]|nr:class I SAM-dependent methyltransferase [Candidatus Binatia bacterium]